MVYCKLIRDKIINTFPAFSDPRDFKSILTLNGSIIAVIPKQAETSNVSFHRPVSLFGRDLKFLA